MAELQETTHMRSQKPTESRALNGMANTMNATGNAEARAHLGPPAKAIAPHVKSRRPRIDTRACSATNPTSWMRRPPSIAETFAGVAPATLRPERSALKFRTSSQMQIARIRKPCWVSDPGFTHWNDHQ